MFIGIHEFIISREMVCFTTNPNISPGFAHAFFNQHNHIIILSLWTRLSRSDQRNNKRWVELSFNNVHSLMIFQIHDLSFSNLISIPGLIGSLRQAELAIDIQSNH
jgi:hypothetical protein